MLGLWGRLAMLIPIPTMYLAAWLGILTWWLGAIVLVTLWVGVALYVIAGRRSI